MRRQLDCVTNGTRRLDFWGKRMQRAVDIVGIGVCTVDHLMTVPHMPGDNVNMRGGQYIMQPGGLASCALSAAARLGARCRIISHVGDDDAGAYIRRQLQREGVDTSLLLTRDGGESHISLILVNETTGERSIMTRTPTGRAIAPDEIRREDIIAAKVLFIDNVNAVTVQAAQWAREAGMTVVLDPAAPYAVMRQILPLVDVPIVPKPWANAWMPGQPAENVALALHEAGARIAVVTLGERGSVVAWRGGVEQIDAFPVDVVDTTGAGDAYHGGFMAALLEEGWTPRQMARFASAVGSLNCRALGGSAALPKRAEVDAALAGRTHAIE